MTVLTKISVGREYTHKFHQNYDLGQLYCKESLILDHKTPKSTDLTVKCL